MKLFNFSLINLLLIMKKATNISIAFILFYLLNNTPVWGQSPGGVGTANLQGWYIAEQGITLTGGAVSGWDDQSPNANHGSQTVAGSRPLVNTTGFNYHQTIQFDGDNDWINIPDLVDPASTGLTVFAVARQTDTSGKNWGVVLFGQSNSNGWSGGGYGLTALSGNNTEFGFWVDDWSPNVSHPTTLQEPTVMAGSWNGTTTNAAEYHHNGISAGTYNYTGTVGDNGPSAIGSSGNSNYSFYGDVAEVIVYDTGLGINDFNRIQSYLAFKYGIPLDTDYVNSSGTTIYTTTAPYDQHTISIARDDNQSLRQKQSQTTDDSIRLYLASLAATNAANTGSFTSDNQYLVMGSDDSKLEGIRSEMPASVYSRLRREWKATNTDFDGSFNLDIMVNSHAVAGGIDPNDLRLLIDTDGDLSDATIYSSADGLTFSYSNPVITISGISNAIIPQNSIRYLTLASISSSTPLPIELISFDAEVQNHTISLRWSTASEENNDFFTIERSTDAIHWEIVTTVPGAGNSSSTLHYQAIDHSPHFGTSYYRLKQTDYDGKFEYFNIRTIHFQNTPGNNFSVYPNPAQHKVQVATNFESYVVEVMNLTGQLVLTKNNARELDVSVLNPGTYLVRLRPEKGELLQHKFVKR